MSAPEDNPKWSGGVILSREMKNICKKQGFLKSAQGGQRLRTLFQAESVNWDHTKLSPFGQACFFGVLEKVSRTTMANTQVKMNFIPTSDHVRSALGYPESKIPERNFRGAHVPKNDAKDLIIKVQVPWMNTSDGGRPAPGDGDLAVYTKKRDFVCGIKKTDQADGASYDKIVDVIKTKGIRGAKAYFAAELRSRDELVVKISEVLAEQPF
ncbi:hypothetical protein VKT23_010883 [Stygiomarasmius scandens]|uniref:Uncharacterized protein n=1 Tax=Marasmiellus scandens TaxID=2682957 RepID=A0ABR1JBC7_9AGAR